MKALQALKTAIAAHKRFIEPVDEYGEYKPYSKIKAFNYYKFTSHCVLLSDETENGGPNGGYILRDMAMETLDAKYKAGCSLKFLEMDMLD